MSHAGYPTDMSIVKSKNKWVQNILLKNYTLSERTFIKERNRIGLSSFVRGKRHLSLTLRELCQNNYLLEMGTHVRRLYYSYQIFSLRHIAGKLLKYCIENFLTGIDTQTTSNQLMPGYRPFGFMQILCTPCYLLVASFVGKIGDVACKR